jgi:predicted porin
MNKKLIAIAVASGLGFAANAASAGEVAVGGHAHISVDYLSTDLASGDERSDANLAVSSNSSRLNFKGSEDLGNGTQVGFFMEWQVGLDGNRASDLAPRNRYAFIKGSNWGEVRVGRHDTPMKIVGRKVDLFYSTQLGENRLIVAQNGFDQRTDNTIAYISPGERFNVLAAYVADHNLASPGSPPPDSEARVDNNDFDAISVALNLNFGGFYGAVAYEQHNISDVGLAPGASDSRSAVRLVGSYTGSGAPWKVTGFYQTTADVGFTDGADQDYYGVGFAWGKQTVFKAAYYVADEIDDTTDTGASNISAGIDYKATKRTMFYVTATLLDNDDNQSYGITGGHDDRTYIPTEAGGDVTGVSFGIRHTF